MTDPKVIQLAGILHVATLNGRIKWQRVMDEPIFRAQVGDGHVKISSHKESEFAPEEYFLSVLDNKAAVVESTDLPSDIGSALVDAIARSIKDRSDRFIDSMISSLERAS
jgi:hypothetical protein